MYNAFQGNKDHVAKKNCVSVYTVYSFIHQEMELISYDVVDIDNETLFSEGTFNHLFIKPFLLNFYQLTVKKKKPEHLKSYFYN